ncbi:MAG TPA: chromate resistance protein ChrB domain-containing protein [Dissulfurispiraceae bacterium]|nr:chromate resistance protein ChrB domain-containing protein [Dissulfurispiraceae bacterium]
MKKNETDSGMRWLMFFYSVPSRPVSNRMKVWRKLMKSGAVHLKGSVYILPDNEEHYETLQWLASEVSGMKGEAAFVRIAKIETMKEHEIMALFDEQRANDYRNIGKTLDVLERRLGSIQKGSGARDVKGLSAQSAKFVREYEQIAAVDFFRSGEGKAMGKRIDALRTQLAGLSGLPVKKEALISGRAVKDYQGRVWVTRTKPFIDRMASAWLIRRFIDGRASFGFIDEKEIDKLDRNSVAFDIRDGEFTHSGDMCTFEVIIKAFGLRDKALRKIAEIVHDLDMKDDKYKAGEARGLEDILAGIRKSARDDADALERGMAVFEMLYISKVG